MKTWSNVTVINTEIYGYLTGNSVLRLSWLFKFFPIPTISELEIPSDAQAAVE